jgi:opacity protein-like surface antigen
MRLLLVLLLTALLAFSQHFSVGVKAGVPLTDFISGVQNQNPAFVTNTNRYAIGGQAEVRLPAGFGIEFDALYRHFNYSSTVVSGGSSAFEFPLLVKYRFPAPVARPFVAAGLAWDRWTGVKQAISSDFKNTVAGFVLGAGLDIHVVVHIQPEIRYTRWGSQRFAGASNLLNSNQNQAEFLVGFSF